MQQPPAPASRARVLDTRALESPVDREAVDQYRQSAAPDTVPPRQTASGWANAVGMSVLAVALVVGVLWGGPYLVVAALGPAGTWSLQSVHWITAAFVFALFLAAACLVGVAASSIRQAIVDQRPWEMWTRMDAFARANGMRFTPFREGTTETGMIFHSGAPNLLPRYTTHDLVELGDGWLSTRVETGMLRSVIGSPSGQVTTEWSYLVIQLDRHLPNMVLDAVQNDRRVLGQRFLTDLPHEFDTSQRLGPEGDFDQYFTLYAPQQYATDALYVFTPDLMALLIDQVGDASAAPDGGPAFDVEIVDDRMYLYSPVVLNPLSPAVWERLVAIVQTVGRTTLLQTTRYADERVGDRTADVVAPAGRRLRARLPTIAVLGFVFLAATWIIAATAGHH